MAPSRRPPCCYAGSACSCSLLVLVSVVKCVGSACQITRSQQAGSAAAQRPRGCVGGVVVLRWLARCRGQVWLLSGCQNTRTADLLC
jgi:hypothetical protein